MKHYLNPTRGELLRTFALDQEMTGGDGIRLWDRTGRAYLDFLSQYGALPFGHNPPEIWAALRAAEADRTPSMVQPLRASLAESLAARLAEVTPGDLQITTFANSGAEAVEAAIKLARARTGRDRILSATNSFHGKTLGALSATGKPTYQHDFAAPAPHFDYVPFGDLATLRRVLENSAQEIAAFIVEPIQGEGGVVCPPDGYLDATIALCREYGVLTIVDEIQTGLGRTGALFVCSDGAETPDMLLLAKALGGGLVPIGACIARPTAWSDRFGQLHSSTFAGNAMACAAAEATLDLLTRDDGARLRHVAEMGHYFRAGLDRLRDRFPDVIQEVRGRGLMLALAFHDRGGSTRSATLSYASLNDGIVPLFSSYLLNVHGILTAPLFNAAHVMRLQPPLVVGRDEIDAAIAALMALCDLLQRGDVRGLIHHLADKAIEERDLPATNAVMPIPRRRTSPAPGRFAFAIHYTNTDDILRSDPSFRAFSDRELAGFKTWSKRLGPGAVLRLPKLHSRIGKAAEGIIYALPMLPEEMKGVGRAAAQAMVLQTADLAAEAGATRLGLGAFTSIVTRGGELAVGRGVPVTSGNTLTTVAAIQGLERVAVRAGVSLDTARVAVIGASGAIGQLAAKMLARRVGSLTLVGNPDNPFSPSLVAKCSSEVYGSILAPTWITSSIPPGSLRRSVEKAAATFSAEDREIKGLADRFAAAFTVRGQRPPIHCTADLQAALDDADIVLVATSSQTTLVDPATLRPGTIVCDVARPPNVAQADLATLDIIAFDGGLVAPPFDIDLGPFQTLPTGICWGCLGETMLLALEGETRDFSIGGTLNLAEADHLSALADKHGFEAAPPSWYGTDLQEETFAAFRARRRAATPLSRVDGDHR